MNKYQNFIEANKKLIMENDKLFKENRELRKKLEHEEYINSLLLERIYTIKTDENSD